MGVYASVACHARSGGSTIGGGGAVEWLAQLGGRMEVERVDWKARPVIGLLPKEEGPRPSPAVDFNAQEWTDTCMHDRPSSSPSPADAIGWV